MTWLEVIFASFAVLLYGRCFVLAWRLDTARDDLTTTRASRQRLVVAVAELTTKLGDVRADRDRLAAELLEARGRLLATTQVKDGAYWERNCVVALLASLLPSVRCRTAIEGWSDDWHGCVYITLPDGSQASWHYHDSQAGLFAHVPEGSQVWDGHTTPEKYERISRNCTARVAELEARAEAAEKEREYLRKQAQDMNRDIVGVMKVVDGDGPFDGSLSLAERVSARLAEAEKWRDAVHEACFVAFALDPTKGTPEEVLAKLVCHEVETALDPRVSEEAAKLRDTYKADRDRLAAALKLAEAEADNWRCADHYGRLVPSQDNADAHRYLQAARDAAGKDVGHA